MDLNINNILKYQQIGGFQQGNKSEKAEEVLDNKTALKTISQLIEDLKTSKISVNECLKEVVKSGLGNVKVTNAQDKNFAEVENPDKKVTIYTNGELDVEGAETIEEAQPTSAPRRAAQSNETSEPKTQLDYEKDANIIKGMLMDYYQGDIQGKRCTKTEIENIIRNVLTQTDLKDSVKQLLSSTTLKIDLGESFETDFEDIYASCVDILLNRTTVISNLPSYTNPNTYYENYYKACDKTTLTNELVKVVNIFIKLYPTYNNSNLVFKDLVNSYLDVDLYINNNKNSYKGIVTTNAECNREFQAYAILTMSGLEKTLHEMYDAELGKEQVTLLYKQVASQAACNPENFEASGKYNNDNQIGAYNTWNSNIRTDDYAPDDTAYRVIPEKLLNDFFVQLDLIKNRELTVTTYSTLSEDVKQELHNIAKCLPENNFTMHNETGWDYSPYAQYFGAEPTFKGEYIFNAEIGMDPSEKLNQRHHTNNYTIKNGQGYNDKGEDTTFNTSHCHEIEDIVPDAIDMMHNMIPIMSQYFDTESDEFNDALYRTMKGLNDLINDVIIMYEGKPSSMSQEEYSAIFAKYNLSGSDIKNNKITMGAYLELFADYGIDLTVTGCGHNNCSCHDGFDEHYSIDLSILMDKFLDINLSNSGFLES